MYDISVYRKSLLSHQKFTPKHFFDIVFNSRRISAKLKDLRLFLKWTVFSLKGLDKTEAKTLFYILDRDRDGILSWADFSAIVDDTEGNIDEEQRKIESERAFNEAVDRLKHNPEIVGEGWSKFKEQVRLKCPQIFGIDYDELKSKHLEYYSLGGL